MEIQKRNLRKERIGVVTSNKMEKSIVVSEVKKVKHPMYGKFVLTTKKYATKSFEGTSSDNFVATSFSLLLSSSSSDSCFISV